MKKSRTVAAIQSRRENIIYEAYGFDTFTIQELVDITGESHRFVQETINLRRDMGEILKVGYTKTVGPRVLYKWAPDD